MRFLWVALYDAASFIDHYVLRHQFPKTFCRFVMFLEAHT